MVVAQTFYQEAKAVVRGIRVSPIKLGLVVDTIRGKTVDKALKILNTSKRRVSIDVKKGLLSAVANAENNFGMNIDSLLISEIYVGKGNVLKGLRPRARGRVGRIKKPFSHLTIIVSDQGNS
jgi:large subunit ribosomal protein L22